MTFLRPKKRLLPLILLLILATGGLAYAKRFAVRDALIKAGQGPIPVAVTREEFLNAAAKEPVNAITEPKNEPNASLPDFAAPQLPNSLNLSVLFIPQAPKEVWDEVHEETCEEAAMAMLDAYLKDRHVMTVDEMEDELLAIVKFETDTLGYYASTDTAATADVMRDFYDLPGVKVVPLTSIGQVKAQIAAGRPVMLPTAGRMLKNPYFKGEGPVYHMVLAKGYAGDRIITNDPGTKRGADYSYADDVLWEAIGEWTGSDVDTSKKSMIIVE
jgi:hypothetical protein